MYDDVREKRKHVSQVLSNFAGGLHLLGYALDDLTVDSTDVSNETQINDLSQTVAECAAKAEQLARELNATCHKRGECLAAAQTP